MDCKTAMWGCRCAILTEQLNELLLMRRQVLLAEKTMLAARGHLARLSNKRRSPKRTGRRLPA
jgi:hypothetical protein